LIHPRDRGLQRVTAAARVDDVRICRLWIFWALVLWLGPAVSGPAQTISGLEIERPTVTHQAPASGISDEHGVFRRNPALLARLSERVQALKTRYGFQIYLVLDSVLVSGSVQELATQLQEEWLPNGNGLVLVFEMDSKSLGFGQGYAQSLEKAVAGNQVPSYETMAILTSVTEQLDRNAAPEQFLETVIGKLTDQYTAYFKRKEAPEPEGRTLRLAMIFVGGVAGLALIGLVVAWLLKRADPGSNRKIFIFPDDDTVVERLGAAYGGGQVSSRRFGRAARGPL
jgi:hypothetical protein